jgi:hypothetical protein
MFIKTVYKSVLKSGVIAVVGIGMSGCVTVDKDRATQQRLSELCRDIVTQYEPQCAGQHAPQQGTN